MAGSDTKQHEPDPALYLPLCRGMRRKEEEAKDQNGRSRIFLFCFGLGGAASFDLPRRAPSQTAIVLQMPNAYNCPSSHVAGDMGRQSSLLAQYGTANVLLW